MDPTTQLPHLLKLLDDPSPTVRSSIVRALETFGPSLEAELSRLQPPATAEQIARIRQLLDESIRSPDNADESKPREPALEVGQLVSHRRYDYRGVVVSRDDSCQAEDDWYLSNRTQPDRKQPWYHVLVHGSHQITYAAQTSLEADDSEEPVDHPLVAHFFSSFADGRYVRNDVRWPDS